MTVNVKNEDELFGALRNAQLKNLFFPGWGLRLIFSNKLDELWLKTYRRFNTSFSIVTNSSIAFEYVPLFSVNDKNIDCLLIRNATSRLSKRDAIIVNSFISSQKASIHVVRDINREENLPGIGLFGFKPKYLPYLTFSNFTEPWHWLQNILYEKIKNDIVCHSHVTTRFSCENISLTDDEDLIGLKYDKRMEIA